MDNSEALRNVFNALADGTPLTVTVQTQATPDGAGITFSGQVQTPVEAPPAGPVIVPPLIPPVVPVPPPPIIAPVPPVMPPAGPAPLVPPIVVPTPEPAGPTPAPAQYSVVTHPIAIPPTLKAPFPHATNAWWENIILGHSRIAPDPYQIEVVDNGYLCCYPSQFFTQDSFGMQHITTQWLQNFSLEFAEVAGSWAVMRYDDLTVNITWTASNGKVASSVIAQGSPYLTMGYVGTTPLFTSQHVITSVNGYTAPGPYLGGKFKVALNNGQTWVVYCSSPLTLTWTGNNQLQAGGPFTGAVRVAILLTPADEAILDQYVGTIPIASTVTTAYNGTSASYTFAWATAGSGQLLMCALPHHMDILKSPQTANLTRQAIKGKMTAIVGNSWTLVESVPQTTWRASKSIDPGKLDAIKAQVQKDAGFVANSTSDSYFASKGLAKMAQLVLLADQIGDTTSMATLLGNLKASLTTWFSRNDLFGYDKTHGGIVFLPALGDNGADFGYSNTYSDHCLHDGYYLYSAAVLAKFDPAWLAAYQEKVTELAHDYCNPLGSSDTRYPTIRNKDMFAGHSWLGGLTDLADNRNIESTSEAINGYAGAMLWGLVSGDTNLQNFARLMMQMEIRSAQKYWHVYPGNNLYGNQWTAGGIGLMWSCKVDDSDWFDAHLSCRRGIQVIPVTQFTELYAEKQWIANLKAIGELDKMISENFTTWPTFVIAMQAVIDPAGAWTAVNALADNQLDDGASRSALMYYIATR